MAFRGFPGFLMGQGTHQKRRFGNRGENEGSYDPRDFGTWSFHTTLAAP